MFKREQNLESFNDISAICMFKSPLTLFYRRYHFRQHQHQYTCM